MTMIYYVCSPDPFFFSAPTKKKQVDGSTSKNQALLSYVTICNYDIRINSRGQELIAKENMAMQYQLSYK